LIINFSHKEKTFRIISQPQTTNSWTKRFKRYWTL